MQATEQQVQMAAKLYEMRDRARRLLGEKYKPHMAELGRILTMTSQRDGKPVLVVATEVAKKRELIEKITGGSAQETPAENKGKRGRKKETPAAETPAGTAPETAACWWSR